MRSLNTSLPRPGRPARASKPDLLQSFKAAAATVTNLYKAAQADLDNSKADGYQEALEDLIGFLDKQNIGVGDGEGWRIRQWAMERIQGGLPGKTDSDSEDEVVDEKRARSSSPVLDRNASPEAVRSSEPPHAENPARSDSAPPPQQMEATLTDTDMTPPQAVFQFSSPVAYPSNNTTQDISTSDLHAASRRAFPSPRRPSNRSQRNLHRTAASNLFSLGNGAGQKRKLMQDFFNIDAFSDRRDRDGSGGGGGNKRGRMT